MSKTRKNPSARDRQRARERRARAARQEHTADMSPLRALRAPYSGYREWYTPTAPLPSVSGDLSQGARALHSLLVALAPLYAGRVPLAAVHLERQIRAGQLLLATDSGYVTQVAVPDMEKVLAETAYAFPDKDLEAEDSDDTGRLLHRLHHLGALVLDDDRVIRLMDLR